MRLSRLEISGFKSFPDRADLAFDDGVTAIVGPNGCGKSNVVDAITWVLGEQSAKSLRGERMEDVIFSGSDARKPTAAAEVRLRLAGVATMAARRAAELRDPAFAVPAVGEAPEVVADEPVQAELPATELRDVEIARRLYRSGESEYLIDGDVCRLRDVQDLLMDAGIGVKGYAVIEQGKIGQILSAKPTDRRQLIEEAAGVTKYKSRRRAAELKLDAAQQNLTRVDDIIYELEKQRNSLKRQSAKARKYRRLREELRRWEKVLFARRYHALEQAIEAARARLEDARAREQAAAAAVADLQATLDATRGGLVTAESHATAAREAAHQQQLETERRQQQLQFNRQQVEALGETLERLGEEVVSLEARREPGRIELEERRGAAVAAEEERGAASAALKDAEQALSRAQQRVGALEHDLDEARRQAFANTTSVSTLRNVIDRAREASERLAGEISRLDAEAADNRVETERVASEREVAGEALRAAQGAIETARAARAAREADLATARIEREWRVNEQRTRERELAGLVARLHSLEELQSAREGYTDAAKAILADASLGIRHHGAVVDAMEADSTAERLAEACLGDILEYVLVSSHDEAHRGLDVLRQKQLGRCGFVVIGDQAATSGGATPDGCQSLWSLLRVGGPHGAAIRAAIGDAWVAETFEQAARAAASTRAPIVTRDGDVFRGGRLVTGGSRTASRGILATKREIKELHEKRATGQAALEVLAEAAAGFLATVTACEADILGFSTQLHQAEKQAIGHEVGVQRAADEISRIQRKIELVLNEKRRAEEERRAQDHRQEEARESIAHHEELQREFDAKLAEVQQQLVAARDEAAQVGTRVAEAKAAHATLVERALAFSNEVRRLEDSGRELEQRLVDRTRERERSAERRASLEAAIVTGEQDLREGQVRLEALRADVGRADAEVAALNATFATSEASVRVSRTRLDEVRAEAGQLDVARATAEADLAHLAVACTETLQLTLDEISAEVAQMEAEGTAVPDAAAFYADDDGEEGAEGAEGGEGGDEAAERMAVSEDAATGAEDEGAVQRAGIEAAAHASAAHAMSAEEAIAELRAKIDRLGAVNMMAIEQYDELEQRHGFLSGQRKDLVEAIAQTGEAIKRIDRTTRERFQEAFVAINTFFGEMFTTLFGGGRAGLVMLDESDLLESGIDIIAQPPGKRLQNVQLLSGGEKALTAMSLMFSIFKYRPSPFCLLDEIDAPLDDANIGRFVEMLRGMQDRTQFILITHHRKTMEIADRLYGVTMEEPGVSKLISLRL